MFIPLGLVLVLALVFGGFTLSGGKFDVLLHALPYEGMMIAGASIGALVIMSDGASLKLTAAGLKRCFSGPRWKKQDYLDLLILLFELIRLMRSGGATKLEPHVEDPTSSEIFSRYPRILRDEATLSLICDSFRMIMLNFDNSHQLEDVIEKRIETTLEEREIASHSLTSMADGLPAIGIVAAVLGVIKTMSSVDQPPEILGTMIGGALVGTFLGVFLAYCVVQPIAERLKAIEETDFAFSKVIRDVIVGSTMGQPPAISVEIGRGSIPDRFRPTFAQVDEAQNSLASSS